MSTYIRDNVLRKHQLFDDPSSIFRRIGYYLYQGYLPSTVFENSGLAELEHKSDYSEEAVYDKNGKAIGKRRIDSLNVPKMVTNFLRRAIMGEGAMFSIDNDESGEKAEFFEEIIRKNNFYTAESDLIELMLNGGDMLHVIGYRRQQVKISFLNGFKFEIVEFEQGQAKSVVLFVEKVRFDKEKEKNMYYTMLELHRFKDDDDDVEPAYEIIREIYESGERYRLDRGVRFNEHVGMFGNFKDHELFPGVTEPMFSFTRLPYRNNKQLDTIRGLGLMINSMDVNRSIDIAYDANNQEIKNTKFKMLVPDEMLEHAYDKQGNMVSFYNSDKSAYVGLNAADGFQFNPIAVSPPIRQMEYTAKIKQDLDLLCMQLGLSPGTLSFDKHQGRVTATQVMSEMNETHRTRVEIADAITRSWRDLIWSIYNYSKEVWNLISWDMQYEDIRWELEDSVIIDDEAEFKKDLEAVRENLMPHREFLMKHYGLGDEEAEEWLSRVNQFDFSDIDLGEADEDIET